MLGTGERAGTMKGAYGGSHQGHTCSLYSRRCGGVPERGAPDADQAAGDEAGAEAVGLCWAVRAWRRLDAVTSANPRAKSA